MKKTAYLLLGLLGCVALLSCNSDDSTAGGPPKDKALDPNAESHSLVVTGMN